MKEQQIIRKLQSLKTIQPSKCTLTGIKKRTYQRVQSRISTKDHSRIQDRFGPIPTLIKSRGIVFYAGAVGFLLIIVLFATLLLPNQLHSAILFGRLALASNQYKRAGIALEDTKSKFVDNKTVQNHPDELAYSLRLTNTQFNKLKLKGETGKYTAEECHQIYKEYLAFLESKDKFIPSNGTLKSEINAYEEQAEKKLHLYDSPL